MAHRGSNPFRRLRIARDGGMEPSALEVVVGSNGGVTFRVYGEKAAALMGVAPETAADADEIAKRKAKPKSKGRGAP
jgi:hypothetical protein